MIIDKAFKPAKPQTLRLCKCLVMLTTMRRYGLLNAKQIENSDLFQLSSITGYCYNSSSEKPEEEDVLVSVISFSIAWGVTMQGQLMCGDPGAGG